MVITSLSVIGDIIWPSRVSEAVLPSETILSVSLSVAGKIIGRMVKATLANGDVVVGLAEGISQDGSMRLRPQATQPSSGTPEVVHLRVADIIHMGI